MFLQPVQDSALVCFLIYTVHLAATCNYKSNRSELATYLHYDVAKFHISMQAIQLLVHVWPTGVLLLFNTMIYHADIPTRSSV